MKTKKKQKKRKRENTKHTLLYITRAREKTNLLGIFLRLNELEKTNRAHQNKSKKQREIGYKGFETLENTTETILY